ncbi:MAG: M3 family oligoendopeptidase [Anaerolineales bacterium]|nr:M3 family oligoendopeptidase [Anaerolineales bacterium]
MSQQNGRYPQTRWNLTKLLPSAEGPAVEELIADLEAATAVIEAFRPQLSPQLSGEEFAQALKAVERFAEIAHRLGSYGPLWFSENTQNQAALAFMGRMEQLLTQAQNRTLFFSLWWKGLDNEAAERLLAYAGDTRYNLEQDRLFKDHILAESEEKIINLKDINGISAMVTLYDMITSKFVFELEVDGEKKELTRDELMTYVRNPDPEIRAAAYQEQFRVYGREATVLAQIYTHRVRDWATENLNLRRFASPVAVRNLANDIPDAVVDTLLDVCAEQAPIFQRYFQLKAGWLGLPKLRRYDLYAPLNNEATKKIDYGDAVEMVLDSFYQFAPEAAREARRIFDDGHIDAEIRPGKRGGAFCAGILPTLTPWVLINYTGEPRQVATLAHELGHAIHALFAAHHSVLTFHSALPLAETASVFSEMLLTDRLLAEESDLNVRRDLLADAVDDTYATVLRQAYFVLFERDAHRLVAEGKTMDELNQHYLGQLKQQFGDAVEISEDFMQEWICIPHIYHTPFYCYAYSFGQLLALSLYQQYKEQGQSFVSKLLKILAYGGAASPQHILSEAGIDMADPDFWRSGFKVIEGMIDELARA